ncbi:transcriptional-regulating factor 1 [Trichomycterus rosablanca]|uniref:transcriptional-regulating factor 1 n=1 Tax=Trichomycterus rosablanca TaxID=2290929 RepID=UPI002F357B7F
MTENLYHLSNDSNGATLQNSNTFTRPCYGISATSSSHPSPVSPNANQKYIPSPTTPQNEIPSLLDIHQCGAWDCNQLEKSASSLLTEAMDSHIVYPFNVSLQTNPPLSCKLSSNVLHPLDSFSNAFSVKNPNAVFTNSVGERCSEDCHVSEMLVSPQSGAPSEGSDRDLFSPVNMQSQPQHNQILNHPIDNPNMAYNFYQSHQQYHYSQLRDSHSEPIYKVPFYTPQNQYLLQQQGFHIQQHQPTSHSSTLQKQLTPVDVREGQELVGSPSYTYSEEHKSPEQAAFQSAGKGLSLHSPQFQGSHHFRSLSHQSELYQNQVHFEQSHLLPLKQDHLASVDDVPKEDTCLDLNYSQKRSDFFGSHYQSVGTGVNQVVPATALRGEVLHHLNRPQWAQVVINAFLKEINYSLSKKCSSGNQDDLIPPYYRRQAVRGQGSKTKLNCILCHREFKSLPALNGHMRSHGGFRTHTSTLKNPDGQMQLCRELTQTDTMVFPVSVPVKNIQEPSRISNLLQNHVNKNYFEDLCSPQQQLPLQKVFSSRVKSPVGVGNGITKQEKKRSRHCVVPLVITSCNAGLQSRGPVLFQSQLRSPGSCGDDVPYTPPPMLSPVRPGSGLFSTVNGGNTCNVAQIVSRVHLWKDSDKDDCNVTPADKLNGLKPQINVGTDFQADIPDIQSHSKVTEDTHKAALLWTPCNMDEPEKQQRVDNLLRMACSSVLPGGGTNTEFTLHCLFECRGNVMTTLEKLLTLEPLKPMCNPYTGYHYAGSDNWTMQEKRQLNKALLIHNKDFYLIQKMVKTKTVAQCVEYYYTWKERLRLGRRFSTGPTTPEREKKSTMKGCNTKSKTEGHEFSELSHTIWAVSVCEVPRSDPMINGDELNHSNKDGLYSPVEHGRPRSAQQFSAGSVKSSPSNSTASGDTDSNRIFPCTECGKVFFKVKSRNAHMKTHRQQDEPQFWQLHNLSEPENQTVTPASPSIIAPQPVLPLSLSFKSGRNTNLLSINSAETLQQAVCLLQNQNQNE